MKAERNGPKLASVKNARDRGHDDDPALTAGGLYRIISVGFILVAMVAAVVRLDFLVFVVGMIGLVGFTIAAELCRVSYRLGEPDDFWNPRSLEPVQGETVDRTERVLQRLSLMAVAENAPNDRMKGIALAELGRLDDSEFVEAVQRGESAWDRRRAQRERSLASDPSMRR